MTRCPIESAEPLGVRIVWTSLVPNFYNMFTFQFSRWKVARNTNLAPQQDQRNTAMFVSRTFPFPPSVTADIFSAPVQSYHRGDSEFNVTTGFRPGPHTSALSKGPTSQLKRPLGAVTNVFLKENNKSKYAATKRARFVTV